MSLPNPTKSGVRLPTEAEWEYAARVGNATGEYYSASKNIASVGWYLGNSNLQLQRAATKTANAQGIYDLSGNVKEWCQDAFGLYSSGAAQNPTSPTSGDLRSIRGGSFKSNERDCFVFARQANNFNGRSDDTGIRLVRIK